MPKTITSVGIEKIGRRFADSIDHAAYTLNGAPKTVEPFRKLVTAEFEKPPSKGLYVAFKYTIIEKETEVQIESE